MEFMGSNVACAGSLVVKALGCHVEAIWFKPYRAIPMSILVHDSLNIPATLLTSLNPSNEVCSSERVKFMGVLSTI